MLAYKLVLQWVTPSIPTFDELIAIENELIDSIGEFGDVDGHDLGTSESNIFIETDDPFACFEYLKAKLDALGWLSTLAAGYRRLDGEQYSPLWPVGQNQFTIS